MRPSVPLARRLIWALLPLLLLWGAWELGARLLGAGRCEAPLPRADDWMEMQASTRYLWQLVPGYEVAMGGGRARINELGVRDELLPGPKGARERRIITLGDSGVFGWGVPGGSTWQEQLEERLRARFEGWDIEVVNLGVPGYSSEQARRLLEDLGWRYEPDLVLVATVFSDCNIDAFQDPVALALVDPDSRPGHRLLRGSRLYCSLWNAWAGWYAARSGTRNRVLVPGIPRDTSQLERMDRWVDLSRVPMARYRENLIAMHEASQERGASMALMTLAQEWDAGLWTVEHRAPPTPDEHLAWMPYRQAMADLAASRGLPLFSMPDAMAQAASEGDPQRLFVDPVHPSAEGATVMAEALAEALAARPELLGLPREEVGP
jgi:lysophospholipase L1-like esterase